MTHYWGDDPKRDDLMTDAIAEMENDELLDRHEAGEHDGDMRNNDCSRCDQDLADAMAEYAWMATAVKAWSGPNPYAPVSQDEMEALRRMK